MISTKAIMFAFIYDDDTQRNNFPDVDRCGLFSFGHGNWLRTDWLTNGRSEGQPSSCIVKF